MVACYGRGSLNYAIEIRIRMLCPNRYNIDIRGYETSHVLGCSTLPLELGDACELLALDDVVGMEPYP